jgi:hypothetical protein
MAKIEPPIELKPETGLPRFRRNASLRLDDGVIVATDGRGRSRRFELDGTDRAPARVRSFGLDKQGLMDGEGNLLALWEKAIWGLDGRIVDLCVAAGIKFGTQDTTTLPPMRSDGIKIFDVPALPIMSASSSIGIVAFAASQVHVAPDVVTVPIMIVALSVALISFVLWRRAERLDPEAAERQRQAIQEMLAEADLDDEDG